MRSSILIPGLKPIIMVILAIVISWFLVHLLAVFGVLLMVAYPIWWFLAPDKSTLFFLPYTEGRPIMFFLWSSSTR